MLLEGNAGGRASIFGGALAEVGGHPTRRIKLVLQVEAPRMQALVRVHGSLHHTHSPGEGRPGDLPRTLAFFAALLLHEIPGEGQGEVSLAGGTLVQMREGLRATLSPRDSRSRTFWEHAYKTG